MSALLGEGRAAKTLAIISGSLIIAVLFVLLAFKFFGGRNTYSKELACKSELQTIATQLRLYQKERGKLPTTGEGLEALTEESRNPMVSPQAHQLMLSVPLDPWGQSYRYLYPGRHDSNDFELYSIGPDGIEGNPDDIYP